MKIHDNVILNSKVSGLLHAYEMKKDELGKILEKLKGYDINKLDKENREKLSKIYYVFNIK